MGRASSGPTPSAPPVAPPSFGRRKPPARRASTRFASFTCHQGTARTHACAAAARFVPPPPPPVELAHLDRIWRSAWHAVALIVGVLIPIRELALFDAVWIVLAANCASNKQDQIKGRTAAAVAMSGPRQLPVGSPAQPSPGQKRSRSMTLPPCSFSNVIQQTCWCRHSSSKAQTAAEACRPPTVAFPVWPCRAEGVCNNGDVLAWQHLQQPFNRSVRF
jgi:hypothetical protein